MDLHYVDGVCGGHKTTNGIEVAVHAALNLDQLVLFVQPTAKLINQSFKTAREKSDQVCIKRFDSVSCPGSVIADLIDFMKNWRADIDGGCVVFITHKCLWEMPFIPNQSNWNVIIDEILDVDFEYHLNLPDTSEFAIQSVLTVTECGINTMLKLKPRAEAIGQVRHWARNPDGDDVLKVVQPLFQELTNQHSNVYVTRASWCRLGIEGHGRIDVHGWRSPSVCQGWQSVRMMGAFFQDSLLSMIWGQFGVQFRPDHQIKVDAHRHDESVGSRVSIHFFSERPWSKHLRNKISELDDPFAAIKPLIRDEFGDNEFLLVANNDVPDGAIADDFPNVVRIPAICHGLNEYRHMTKILFLPALNNSPGHFSYLDKVLGISGDRLRQARSFQVAYQSIMRTALRDAGSTDPVSVIVPDISMASWLGEVFPGSRLKSHEIESLKGVLGAPTQARGRPRQASVLSPIERKNLSIKKAQELLVTKNSIYIAFFVTGEIPLSYEKNLYSTGTEISIDKNWDDIRDGLITIYDKFCPRKESNAVMSPASFDPDRSTKTNKGLENITAINGVWLDFDGGKLLPEEFARIFTDVRWLMWNSFNNGKEGLVKYRVMFPTSTPLIPDMYHMIWDVIAERIRGFGYYVGPTRKASNNNSRQQQEMPDSGLDYSKRSANSFFYLPCRAGLGKKHTFWRENWNPDTPFMDPDRWVSDYAPIANQEYAPRAVHLNPKSLDLKKLIACLAEDRAGDQDGCPTDRANLANEKSAALVGEACSTWRAIPKGSGDRGFFDLGLSLRGAGKSEAEIIQILYQEAAHGRSPKDRRRQVPEIMKWLSSHPDRKSAA